MLGRDLHLGTAGDEVHRECVVAAEHPAACRQCPDTVAATRDDTVEAGRWCTVGDGGDPKLRTDEECRSLPVSVGASASDSSSANTVIWPAFHADYQPSTCVGSPGNVVDQMTTGV